MFAFKSFPQPQKQAKHSQKKGLLLFDFACHPCTGTMHLGHCTVKQGYNLLCVLKQSSLHCEANLLCIVKRLFNAWAETQASNRSNFWVYKVQNFDLKTNSVPF